MMEEIHLDTSGSAAAPTAFYSQQNAVRSTVAAFGAASPAWQEQRQRPRQQ
jgi:hypothetical protein